MGLWVAARWPSRDGGTSEQKGWILIGKNSLESRIEFFSIARATCWGSRPALVQSMLKRLRISCCLRLRRRSQRSWCRLSPPSRSWIERTDLQRRGPTAFAAHQRQGVGTQMFPNVIWMRTNRVAILDGLYLISTLGFVQRFIRSVRQTMNTSCFWVLRSGPRIKWSGRVRWFGERRPRRDEPYRLFPFFGHPKCVGWYAEITAVET